MAEADLTNFSVRLFRIYVACALLAAGCESWLIKRLLRWRGDESLEIYLRTSNETWAKWIGRTLHAKVDSTIAGRARGAEQMDFSEETQQKFSDIARAMLTLSGRVARAATGPL